MRTSLPDGLYQVTTPYLCAGFVVAAGKVVDCAPILRKKLGFWVTLAVRIGDAAEVHPWHIRNVR
ncbi:MAG: hypothetical protein U0931_05010 [Vulcanimicrobiota bacterium]